MANHLDLEEQEQLDQLKHFWAAWGTLISVVLTVVLVALAGWNGYKFWQARQATQASALFDAVQASSKSQDLERLEQAFDDMRKKYPAVAQTFQAGLLVAKTNEEAGKLTSAKDALTWLASNGSPGEQTIARLRLASVLVAQGQFEDALSALNAQAPQEFTGVIADRKGDVFSLMGKPEDAVAQYKIALNALEQGLEYRRLVEVKLNALGTSTNVAASAESKGENK